MLFCQFFGGGEVAKGYVNVVLPDDDPFADAFDNAALLIPREFRPPPVEVFALDTSFDGDGWRIDDFGSTANTIAYDVAVANDGRVVIAGKTGADFAVAAYDGGKERLYAQQDANYNVTSVTDAYGVVKERYLYDPYGAVTYNTAAWGSQASSNHSWVYLHQGGRYDGASKLYHFRNRDYSAALGRWVSTDPIGYADGMNLHEFVGSRPTTVTDPSGLKWGHETVGPYPVVNEQGQPVDRYHTYYHGLFKTYYKGPTDRPRFSGNGCKAYDNEATAILRDRAKAVDSAKDAALNAFGKTGLGPTGEGLLLGAALPVVFKTSHIMRHFKGTSVTQEALEQAVKADLAGRTCKPGFNEFETTVGGTPIIYRPHLLPDGTINVGTAFPK